MSRRTSGGCWPRDTVEILRNSAALSSSIQKVIGLRHRAAEEMRQLRHQLDQYQRASDSLQRRIDRLKQKRASLQLEEANLLESLQYCSALAGKVHEEWQSEAMQLLLRTDGWLISLKDCRLRLDTILPDNQVESIVSSPPHSPMVFVPKSLPVIVTQKSQQQQQQQQPVKRLLANYRPHLDQIKDC